MGLTAHHQQNRQTEEREMKTAKVKIYMNNETGSVDTADGWDYENEDGETVNGVELGEAVEVRATTEAERAADEFLGDWVEVAK